MDNSFSIDVNHQGDSQNILISGELIINYTDDIKNQLIKSIDFSKKLNIKITNPSSIDVTFIQIILAIKTSYRNSGLSFDINGTLNEEVFALVANAGFKNLFKL